MTKRLFGTDGMRGEAGRFPLDAETIRAAGRSLTRHLTTEHGGAPRLIIGRDTRESGAWIEHAFTAGAQAAGARCESAGVITTPGVAFLTRELTAAAGVVISASHNPYHDNGIKIFAPSGRKLDERIEKLIEADIADEGAADAGAKESAAPPPEEATARDERSDVRARELRERYLQYLAAEAIPELCDESFGNRRLVLDCANGAAAELAPALFRRLGVGELFVLHNTPDGRNINRDCGSLHLERLRGRVIDAQADLGVAYDGDADRALFVDHRGEVVDGDATLWALTKFFLPRGGLETRAVVATVMSNIGLERALRSVGVQLVRTDVGDKYVLEELLRARAELGGEQSGHIIFPRVSLAGDGMLTTLYLLLAMRETGQSLAELTAEFVRYPQVLVNVRVREKRPFADVPAVAAAQRQIEARLGDRGRLLLRYSGTEPLARVMIEGDQKDEIDRLADHLASTIKNELA